MHTVTFAYSDIERAAAAVASPFWHKAKVRPTLRLSLRGLKTHSQGSVHVGKTKI